LVPAYANVDALANPSRSGIWFTMTSLHGAE
jgi:hypothetical protein